MRTKLLALAMLCLFASVPAWSQCTSLTVNPITGQMDCVGSAGSGASTGAANVFTRGQTITGSADEGQLDITGYSGQTGYIFRIRKSDGTVFLQVNADGSVQVGAGTGPQEWTEQAAPTTPSAGSLYAWADSTNKGLWAKDNTGVTSRTAVPLTASGGQFLTGMGSDGVFTRASTSAIDKSTWGLCIGTPCATAANITANYIVVAAETLTKCYISAKTAPTGATLIVDVLNNGTSIFGAGTKLVLAISGTYATQSTIANSALVEGDILTTNISQIGSTVAGQDVTVVCKATL